LISSGKKSPQEDNSFATLLTQPIYNKTKGLYLALTSLPT